MLDYALSWLRYGADGPWWTFALSIAGVVGLGMAIGALIRDRLSP